MNNQHKQIIAEFRDFLESRHLLEAYITNSTRALAPGPGQRKHLNDSVCILELVDDAFNWGNSPQEHGCWARANREWEDACHEWGEEDEIVRRDILAELNVRRVWTEQI